MMIGFVRRIFLGIVLSIFLATSNSFAYKEGTHEEMSKKAANVSFLSQIGKLADLGLLYPIDDNEHQTFLKWDGKGFPLSILDLIQYGANFEDSGTRALSHFFNPVTNKPLTKAGISLINNTSPDWALEDNGDILVNAAFPQTFSYKDARQYFYEALTTVDNTERNKKTGLTFQTLVQFIHHVQDMAQPQHVRNDAHLD